MDVFQQDKGNNFR